MFKTKNIELKYKYNYSESPVKIYKLNKKDLDRYLSKYNNSQQIVQLKASPFFKIRLEGCL